MLEEEKRSDKGGYETSSHLWHLPPIPLPSCHSVGCHSVMMFALSFKQKIFFINQKLRPFLSELRMIQVQVQQPPNADSNGPN